jgi:hypothetical protein
MRIFLEGEENVQHSTSNVSMKRKKARLLSPLWTLNVFFLSLFELATRGALEVKAKTDILHRGRCPATASAKTLAFAVRGKLTA